MAAAKPRARSMKLKKTQAPVKKSPKPRLYCICTGTPNERADVRMFASEAKAREVARAVLTDWRPWCERYNSAGLPEIQRAVDEIDSHAFDETKRAVTCNLDGHTGVKIVIELWKVSQG